MYANGRGVSQNSEIALRWFARAAQQGNIDAELYLVRTYRDSSGESRAHETIGPSVSETGTERHKSLAEQGDADAQFNLGLAYLLGEGVHQDDEAAVKWQKLAAEQGHTRSQLVFGYLYSVGRGAPQDDVYAHMWSNIAASAGDQDAENRGDELTERMTPAQIAEAQKLARACTRNNYQGC